MTDKPQPPASRPFGQEQFLSLLSREDALARFAAALFPRPLAVEERTILGALGLPLAADVVAPLDIPPFDRSAVDGYAVRSADIAGAAEGRPVPLVLAGATIHCGTAPTRSLRPGEAIGIATGAPLPRGADAVVMVEHTDEMDGRVLVRRSAAAGQFVAYSGSDIARGETLLRAGTLVGSREVGMLAACGIARVPVVRPPRVAVLSTGDELVAPGEARGSAGIYDSNGPIVAAMIEENGGEPCLLGIVPDDAERLETAMRDALGSYDMLILSGGTSKGAGDLSHRIVSRLGAPGIIAHGIALKPGKPLCLAVCQNKPLVILPGFPTSAMFTFHDMIVPILRSIAGLPARADTRVEARVPLRLPSELGRTEFAMVSLVEGDDGLIAFPGTKGSGAVTAFGQADGFVTIEALADHLPAGARVPVTLLTPNLRLPDLVIVGSHCVGLDRVTAPLAQEGLSVRTVAVGSLGGLAAARRGECDLAPIHLLDEATESYNAPFLAEGLELVPGWRRMQGIAFRPGDARFEGRSVEEAAAAALADPACILVNRNAGSGTRILVDRLLRGARPDGYANQPRSHNAVAASIAQGRADWGVTIEPAARAAGVGFIPLAEEHYDFALVSARRDRGAVQAFLASLHSPESRAALEEIGFFRPAD